MPFLLNVSLNALPGEVSEGLEVIDKIAAVKTLPGDRPAEDVTMRVVAKAKVKKPKKAKKAKKKKAKKKK